MYDRILIPTDGSDASAQAVEEGVAIAADANATVYFLHVVDEGTMAAASGVGTIAGELAESLRDVAEEALSDATATAAEAGVEYERAVIEGIPHEAIEAYAAEHDVDLVVVGVTGQTGLKEHLLGSTTQRVAQSVDESVLVARG